MVFFEPAGVAVDPTARCKGTTSRPELLTFARCAPGSMYGKTNHPLWLTTHHLVPHPTARCKRITSRPERFAKIRRAPGRTSMRQVLSSVESLGAARSVAWPGSGIPPSWANWSCTLYNLLKQVLENFVHSVLQCWRRSSLLHPPSGQAVCATLQPSRAIVKMRKAEIWSKH